MAQVAWGYVEIGSQLVRAYVRDDGAVCTAAGSVIEDIDDTMLWKTRRSVDAVLGESGARVSTLASIALVGPNGGMTDAARAIAGAQARNAGVYTTEELLTKCGHADTYAAFVAFYGEAEVIAA